MKVWLIFVISFVVFSLGGGIGWFFWYKSKPKARTWIARCYTIGEGVLTRTILHKKKATAHKIRLKDLKPYTIDVLKQIKGKSDTIYKLVKQNLTTGAIDADMVDNWGKNKLEVNVLINGDSATLMKKSYDHELGEILFRPMDRERVEMIKSEMAVATSRYEETKGLLASVLPWVALGMIAMALVATAYFQADTWIKTGDKVTRASKDILDSVLTISSIVNPDENQEQPTETREPPDIQ